MSIPVRVIRARDPQSVRRLLDRLPDWFGIRASNEHYVTAAARMASYLAHWEGAPEPVGALLLQRHFPESAEIYFLAVDPQFHRRGVGTALLAALVSDLRAEDVPLLQVKTLGPSRPHAGYAATRAFYRAAGFLPMEELHDLWPPGNPCLVMVRPLPSRAG